MWKSNKNLPSTRMKFLVCFFSFNVSWNIIETCSHISLETNNSSCVHIHLETVEFYHWQLCIKSAKKSLVDNSWEIGLILCFSTNHSKNYLYISVMDWIFEYFCSACVACFCSIKRRFKVLIDEPQTVYCANIIFWTLHFNQKIIV